MARHLRLVAGALRRGAPGGASAPRARPRAAVECPAAAEAGAWPPWGSRACASSAGRQGAAGAGGARGGAAEEPDGPEPDLYEVLELPRGSGPEEIKAAYRRLVRECHPDVRPGDAAAAARFRQVSHAHTTLLHVGLRRMYDLHLRRMEGIENCRRLEEQRRGQGIAARLRGRGRGALGALALGAGLGALLVAALAAAMLSLPGFFWTAFHRIPDWVPGKWGLVRLHSQATFALAKRSGGAERPPG